MASVYRAPSGVVCLIWWWLAICSTHIDSAPFHTMRALVSPVCSVSSRRTGYATRRSSSSASNGPATAISPRPSRKRRVSGSRSTRCSCSNVARIRETVLLCSPTRFAISVTPSKGSSAVNVRSTAMALTMTEVPLVSPFPVVPGDSAGVMVSTIIPHEGPKAAPRSTWRRFWVLPSGGLGASGSDDVVFGAERELRDVLGSVFADHQDVVLTVAAGAGLAVQDGDHRFHGHHHAGLQHGVDVLAEFQSGFAAVVVAQDAEGVSVAERPVGEKSVADVDLVQLGGDVLADSSGLDELEAALVDFHVDVPQFEGAGVGFAVEQGALQCGVVAGGHGEAVQGQDVVFLDLPRGGPVVGAVGVDAGLEPYPGVTDFRIREGPGDLVDHGFGADQGDFVLGDAGCDGVADGFAAQVADAGAVLDDLDLFGRLDHPLAHGCLGDVHQGGPGEGCLDLVAVVQ